MKKVLFPGQITVRVIRDEKSEAKILKLSLKDYRHLQDLERFEQAAATACREESTPEGRRLWNVASRAVSQFRQEHGLDAEGGLAFF